MISRRFSQNLAALSALAASLLCPSPVFAAGSDSAKQSPRFVVNLLDYVGADYGGAVQGGKVKSESEYHEQLEFVGAALKAARTLPETSSATSLHAKIERLQKLVESKAPTEEVAALAQQAKLEAIEVAHVEIAPSAWPSLHRGRQLFAQNCAVCHGPSGYGDGPGAKGLEPTPANFHAEKMSESSPFKSFNVIRVGVPGTAMAGFSAFSDRDVWDLAFYVNSLRFAGDLVPASSDGKVTSDLLPAASTRSDQQLLATLSGTDSQKRSQLVAIRLHSGREDDQGALALARANLKNSGDRFRDGQEDEAKTLALKAYLEGIEPVEPKLRATDPEFTATLEGRMADVRSAIEARSAPSVVQSKIQAALGAVDQAEALLHSEVASPWVTFSLAMGILMREGLEAVLILIALLAVIRASGTRKAAAWVHAGWASAVALGFVAWFFSGWVMGISGAQREMMEAVTAGVAIAVLLYMGFWLHSRTEIHRWKQFIDVQVKSALEGSNLYGLFAISFMAVFREAFETVLFLRAVWLDAGDGGKTALTSGVFSAFGLLFVAAWGLLKFSSRVPIRRIFSVSSVLMIALAVILAGKGMHSLQETGATTITAFPLNLRWELLGIFPTRETWLAQIIVLSLSFGLWKFGNRPHRPVMSPVAAR